MTAIVGIFENEQDVDKVVERPAAGLTAVFMMRHRGRRAGQRRSGGLRPLRQALLRGWSWAMTNPICYLNGTSIRALRPI
jgi:hypothetical protein